MATFKYKYTGTDTLDESLDSAYLIPDSTNGLTYVPATPLSDDEELVGYGYHTHYPYEGPNLFWVGVKCELTHSSTAATPSYRNIISLYGLNGNHDEELIGEKVYTSINTTPTTERVSFDLMKSAHQPTLILTKDATSTPGHIDVKLPIRYTDNYSGATLTVLGATPVTLQTPSTYDTLISFATPSPWYESSPAYLTITEYNGSSFVTNSVDVMSTSVLELGYDGLDKYDALRLGFEITTVTTPYTVNINNFEYKHRA